MSVGICGCEWLRIAVFEKEGEEVWIGVVLDKGGKVVNGSGWL